MILLVLGAGASFDSYPRQPPQFNAGTTQHGNRMPLANHLFEDRTTFKDAMRNYPQFKAIIPFFYHERNGSPVTVESVLQTLRNEAINGSKVRHVQLAAVKFYLREAINQAEKGWKSYIDGISNHLTLFDSMRHARPDDEVCIVTFNYDTLIEHALQTMKVFPEKLVDLSDYVSHSNYKLLKLHGSINWARQVNTLVINVNDSQNREHRFAEAEQKQLETLLIERSDELDISKEFLIISDDPFHKQLGLLGEPHLYPALAIPVEEKSDFECPQEHVNLLCDILPNVDFVTTIGWKGGELPFLSLMAQFLNPDAKIQIVSGNEHDAITTQDNLHNSGVTRPFTLYPDGFTKFVRSRAIEDFLHL